MSELGALFDKYGVFGIAGATTFGGESGDSLDTGHADALEVANGTLALTFTADNVAGARALFSKDGNGYDDGGHLTAWIKDGALYIRQQSDTESEYLRVPDVTIEAGVQHHLAVSFGQDGLKVYLDGALVAAEPEFRQGLDTNTRPLLIGASGTHRSDDSQTPRDPFDGTIADVMLFDRQLDPTDMAALAGAVNPAFETAALATLAAEDLMPAFAQLHHGTDTAKALASVYGFDHNGNLIADAAVQLGSSADEALSGGDAADVLQGSYGNDSLTGGAGNDVLDGGHGEDTLDGGDGDDLLIAQADGREPYIAFDPDRDEADPDNELDPATGKLYPDQPIPADDVLTGGAGADTFYFQTLINAKQRFLEEHTQDDGTIRWHGVAGENANLHDHWVDVIGNDVITDFSRAEGDRIVIEGHTTKIASITYGDANGDNVVDHSVIQLYSDQGNNGGAHNQDLLGTITVYGDLVRKTDITTSAAPAYGIVKSIDDLDEALAPQLISQDTGPITPPAGEVPVANVPDDKPEIVIEGGDTFDGTADNDYLVGSRGDDAINGLSGNDILTGGRGNDTLTGGDGIDTANYDGNSADYTVTELGDGRYQVIDNVNGLGTDVLDGIEGLYFFGGEGYTSIVDLLDGISLDGTMDDDYLLGSRGNDTINGGRGNDILTGSVGDDTLNGGDGIDTANYAGTSADYTVIELSAGRYKVVDNVNGLGTDVLDGIEGLFFFGGEGYTAIADLLDGIALDGSTGDDYLVGSRGDDAINGLSGNDILTGGRGNDTLTGGDGIDTANYDGNSADYTVTELGDGRYQVIDNVNGLGTDVLDGIEGLYFFGGEGYTSIVDLLDGISLDGTMDDDYLLGSRGNDTINGGRGNDILTGSVGDDTLNGGDGIDTANYAGTSADYTVIELSAGRYKVVDNVNGLGTDVLDGIEGLFFFGGEGYTAIADLLDGIALEGTPDDDNLAGGAGDDLINGLGGNDTLSGGAGRDTFDFDVNFGNDIIIDFEDGSDLLNFGGLGLTFESLNFIEDVNGTTVSSAAGSVLLEGVSLGRIDENDFLFG